LKVARQERSETMSSGKLFQTAGAACEKARSAKARLVRSSCSRFLPQDRSWREAA